MSFSETVGFLEAPEDEFNYKINGVDVSGTNAAVTVVPGVGNDAGKLVVSFAGVVDSGADGDATTTADNKVFIDVDGDGAYNTGDILFKTGTTVTPGATTVTVSELTSLEASVVASPSTLNIQDGSVLDNALKANTKIVVK